MDVQGPDVNPDGAAAEDPGSGGAEPRRWSLLTRIAYAEEVDRPLGLPVVGLLRGLSRILEIGTGPPGWSWRRLLPQGILSTGVGLDAYRPYLLADPMSWGARILARGERLPFRDGAFDGAIALDVLEHLEKEDGLRLIGEMERVSRIRCVIFTPNGFLPQSAEGVPTQVHRSGWTVGDLMDRGYRVRGVRGWRRLRGDHAKVVIRPALFGHLTSVLTEPAFWWFPERAFQLLAVKQLRPGARRSGLPSQRSPATASCS